MSLQSLSNQVAQLRAALQPKQVIDCSGAKSLLLARLERLAECEPEACEEILDKLVSSEFREQLNQRMRDDELRYGFRYVSYSQE